MASDATSGLATRLPRRLRSFYELLFDTHEHWRATRTLRLGAGLAYYALFAVVPLLSLTVAILARLVSADQAEAFLRDGLDGFVGANAEQVAASLVSEVEGVANGLGALGFVMVLVSASFLFLALQDALNVIWQAPVRRGLKNTLRRRLLAVSVALAVAAFFISSLLIHAVVGLAERLVPGEIPLVESISELLASTASWAVGVLTIALLFRVLPYAAVRWRDAMIGAVMAAVLVSLGTWLVGAYLARFGYSSLTGAAGGAVLFLVLVYYQAQILLGGAVVAKVIGDRSAADVPLR